MVRIWRTCSMALHAGELHRRRADLHVLCSPAAESGLLSCLYCVIKDAQTSVRAVCSVERA